MSYPDYTTNVNIPTVASAPYDTYNVPIYRNFIKNPAKQSIFIDSIENALIAIKEYSLKYSSFKQSTPIVERFNESERYTKKHIIVEDYVFIRNYHDPLYYYLLHNNQPVIINNINTSNTNNTNNNSSEFRNVSSFDENIVNGNKKKKEDESENKSNNTVKYFAMLLGSIGILGAASYFITSDYVAYSDTSDVADLIEKSDTSLITCKDVSHDVKYQQNYINIRDIHNKLKPTLQRKKRFHLINAITKITTTIPCLILLYGLLYGSNTFFLDWKGATTGVSLVISIIGHITNKSLYSMKYNRRDFKIINEIGDEVESILKQDYPLYPSVNPESY